MMDEKLTEVSQLFDQIRAAFLRRDYNTCAEILSQNKIQKRSYRVSLDINPPSLALVLESFGKVVETFIVKAGSKIVLSENVAAVEAMRQCLMNMRCIFNVYQAKFSLSDSIQLLNTLLSIVECCFPELYCSAYSSHNQMYVAETGRRILRYNDLWEISTIVFNMIGEVFSKIGSSCSVEIWQSTIEVLKKVMDVLASLSLVEDSYMARFYNALLHCLHLVLVDPKGSLSDHVAGLIAALRMFFIYGLTKSFQPQQPVAAHEKELTSTNLESNFSESKRRDSGPYRPPHLRRKNQMDLQQPKSWGSPGFSDRESSSVDYTSSDSDYSDNDGTNQNPIDIHSSKARIAAIVCIQDLCRADPKSFTAQWSMLLPSNDVLKTRKYEATLMTCLIFDPYVKARIASASTLAAMLDGPASVFLQVAEYKESTKCGSFMALSSLLGLILMQLHTGILHLIQHESHSKLLASSFKILMLLISSTPYARMPVELLQMVVSSLQARIGAGFPTRSDQTDLLSAAISCLTAAISVSPSSLQVEDMFVAELSTGFVEAQGKSGVLSIIFQYSELSRSPTICLEALQALKAVSHNYPNVMVLCWDQVSTLVSQYLRLTSSEVPTRPLMGHVGSTTGLLGEKLIAAAIKVLDECLRAISGFKGTEALLDDKLLEAPFTSDYTRIKKISSAPSYGSKSPIVKCEPVICQAGRKQWCEAIEKHMPLILYHASPVVKAASVTCFAGITSTVFFSLPMEKQGFVLTSSINAAIGDEVPSVRSAGCRAIGVITCFPQISECAEILDKFIHAVNVNARSPLVSVRITASWALANICDSLRHYMDAFNQTGSKTRSELVASLIECALRLTKDGDKIKANAVRALGNLSRYVQITSMSNLHDEAGNDMELFTTKGSEMLSASSDLILSGEEELSSKLHKSSSLEVSYWLERMVQAFLSCVTTGNVKVQWNVCHALSNLFLNETLKLHDMDWAPSVFSILLLLLRDSPNFKIKIQAAAALAVPATMSDYGRSFSDVLRGVENILETVSSDQISTPPSSFKYKVALEKQLISTMLHVVGLASETDDQSIKDFLFKKAVFLENWLKVLCRNVGDGESTSSSSSCQKKEAILKTIGSLVQVYQSTNHLPISLRLKQLAITITSSPPP